ncbi:MAG TPA: C39 family peptidase [Terriglobales bacterium]|jgi:ABC-type bacteriocin/lantibiotic exporter with double-glycine peptidase domain
MFRRTARIAAMTLCFCLWSLAADVPGIWLDVPFVKQTKDGCGAATIAMVMQYWSQQAGHAADASADFTVIQQQLYSPKAHGIFASDMEHYFQQHGFRTFTFRGDWDEVKHHLEKGRPLIAALKPSKEDASLHYLVIAGLNWQDGTVMVNDPAQRKLLKEDRSTFEREWNATGKWTLLAIPQQPAKQ